MIKSIFFRTIPPPTCADNSHTSYNQTRKKKVFTRGPGRSEPYFRSHIFYIHPTALGVFRQSKILPIGSVFGVNVPPLSGGIIKRDSNFEHGLIPCAHQGSVAESDQKLRAIIVNDYLSEN